MDSLTHIVLGACVGEIIAEKRVGKKAWLFGALAQSLPDIDFFVSFFLSPSENLLAHRGFTHSIVFVFLSSFVLAFVSRKILKNTSMNIRQWAFFWGIQSFIHIFLDTCNNYGVGWLEPFHHARFSFNVLFVADPFFTIWVLIAAISFVIIRKQQMRRKWSLTALILSALYLSYAFVNKQKIERSVDYNLKAQGISSLRYFTTPTPLNSWLWYIVVKDKNGFYLSHRSVFDTSKLIDFYFIPRQDSLISTTLSGDKDLYRLIRFSQGFYTLEKWNDSLIFNDLRFGQMQGWRNPKAKFVFHYFLHAPADNMMVIQRGRFQNWNMGEVKALIRRIEGN